MAPRLVFVHGIGRPSDPDSRLLTWSRALAEGCVAAGHSRFAQRLASNPGQAVALGYYADLFTESGGQGSQPADIDDAEFEILSRFLTEIIEEQLSDEPDEEVRDAMERALLQLTAAGQPQGPGQAARRTINALTTILSAPPLRGARRWADGRLMFGDLAQVARYLGRGEADAAPSTLDERIRARISEAVGDGPAVVVAHSLGSVVAVEALHRHTAEVPLLATLGSPIAMRSVVWPKLRPQPPQTPERVGRWLNFWDRDDVIVARPRLERDIRPNSAGVLPASSRVDSDGLWTHSVVKYLRQPAVAGPIAETAASIGLI